MITYSDFDTYPILIIGLTEENNTELAAMEVVATEMLDYSGDVVDVADIIKYLVFILFWQEPTFNDDRKYRRNFTSERAL